MTSPSPHASFLRDASDPLTRQYLAQNRHETPEQRRQRETEVVEAAKRSKEIDQWLRAERHIQQKGSRKQRIVRVILVGQSESGKSTTIKNFQLQYAPQTFRAERGTWKTVIHLNLVRSVRHIHDALSSLPPGDSLAPDTSLYPSNAYGSTHALGQTETDEDYELAGGRYVHASKPKLSPKHRLLLMRLRPILDLDAALMHQLTWSNSDHSTDKSGLHAAGLFVPFPSSSPPTSSRPSWWGKEVPDDQVLWPSTSGTSTFSSISELSTPHISQTPSMNLLRSATSEGSLSSRSGDEPLIYASIWSKRVPSIFNAQPDDSSFASNRSRGSTSSERLRGDSTANRQAKPEIPVFSETISATAGPSVPIVSVSRKPSSSSIGSQRSQRSTRSRHLSLTKVSSRPSTKERSEPSGFRRALNTGSVEVSKATSEPGDGTISTTDRIMAACASDIAELWKDSTIRHTLDNFFGIRMESEAGFFLDDVERVTTLGYEPTDDDVLKARLKTLGVSEYRFIMGPQSTKTIGHINEMIIYDVGGSRTQRHQWMNYFEDVDSLIFLAPLSAYDQSLVEDHTVNRVQDTLNLWKSVCSSPLLKNVDFILFLNKCDLLESKLRKGIPFQKYVKSYKGPETLEAILRFFKSIFTTTWHRANETLGVGEEHEGRTLHIHRTSVVDSRATKKVIMDVRDTVARSYLRGVGML